MTMLDFWALYIYFRLGTCFKHTLKLTTVEELTIVDMSEMIWDWN